MGLKFWVFFPFFYPNINRPYRELVDEAIAVAQAAEDLGYEGIALPEHHFFNYICNPSALQYATLIGAKTKRLKILTAVLVLPYYNPLALAEEIALVDYMTEGRLQVGVARGANKYEFDRLGVDWRNSRAMYEESLEIMQRAWTESDIAYEGQFWSFPSVTAIPRPYQKPYPKLWTTAQSLTGVRGVAEKGQNMITSPNLGTFGPHGDFERVMDWYNKGLEEFGQRRGDIMVQRRVYIDETEEQALRQLDNVIFAWSYYMSQFKGKVDDPNVRFSERTENEEIVVKGGSIRPAKVDIKRDDIYGTYDDPIMTSPEKAIARFKYYQSLGVTDVLTVQSFGEPLEEALHSMEMLAKHVMPAFAESREPEKELVVEPAH